jgi:hypothetical protein
MRVFILLIALFFLHACCETQNELTYSYNETNIVRLDGCGETTFTYIDKYHNTAGTISVKYSGVVSGFSGYLKFEENGKVYLLSGDGSFQSKNVDTAKFEYKRIFAYTRPNIGDRVCCVMNATNIEQKRNSEENTGIKINYKLND